MIGEKVRRSVRTESDNDDPFDAVQRRHSLSVGVEHRIGHLFVPPSSVP